MTNIYGGVTMTIEQEKTAQSTIVLSLSGHLDAANAPLLERKIKQWGEDITELILDFKELSYISSMGLRVLLQAKKTFKDRGRKLVIRNMGDTVREVFEMTGFLNLMVQEEKFIVIRKDEASIIVLFLNGEMKSENIPVVSKELSGIKEQKASEPETVILDMEKLTLISASALKQLKQAIEDTAWKERTLMIRNAAPHICVDLEKEGMGKLLDLR
jgi:anti-sigma B factor antagonist